MQGLILSLALTERLGGDYLRVIDPHHEPLARWKRTCHACGMRYLRSPGGHNVVHDTRALFRFARATGASDSYRPLYQRPTLALFQRHADHLIERHHLRRLYLPGTVRALHIHNTHIAAESDAGPINARRVILALGSTGYPRLPAWYRALGAEASRAVHHIYSANFYPEWIAEAAAPLIIGGGLSGAQLALRVASLRAGQGRAPPTLVTRRPFEVSHFDSDPCYLGPKCLRGFAQLQGSVAKARAIAAARHPGTLPPDIAHQLAVEIEAARIVHTLGTPHQVCATAPQDTEPLVPRPSAPRSLSEPPPAPQRRSRPTVTLTTDTGSRFTSDGVVLATGFENPTPREPLIVETAARYTLPLDQEGTPLIDSALRWHPRILVCGAPAVLEVGPAAPNIIGAHLALRRVLPLLCGEA